MRVAALIALTLLVCACHTDVAPVVDITTLDQFNPGALTVTTGTHVVWKNVSTTPHTVTSDSWDSGDLYPGQTWTHTFDSPGRYLYKDRYAGSNGTIGIVNVQPQ